MCPITFPTAQNKTARRESTTDCRSISTDEKSSPDDAEDRADEDELRVRPTRLSVAKCPVDDEVAVVSLSN